MRYLYIIVAIISITIVSIFTFKEDFIFYNYAKYTIENEDKLTENIYYYEDDFSYVNPYQDLEIHNKEELFEAIYYIINSGATDVKRYFSIDYKDFEKDYNEIFSKEPDNMYKEKFNAINNFVHPYNTFDGINVSLKGYTLKINIEYKDLYTEAKINKIDNKVNELINELTNDKMTDREKIKVIHDYIVNNTKYDKDFCVEEDLNDCETTSPYEADTAYGVLFEHYGICSGYTDLMAIFLDKLNITNYRITNDSHTWNAVKLDNKWYHLDTTWDDPVSDDDILWHTYFLITTDEDTELEDYHIFDKNIFRELN